MKASRVSSAGVNVSGSRGQPRLLDRLRVARFLSHLGQDRGVSASTQNQALSAVLFIRTVQTLLGHKDVSTTMIYTQVVNRPLDVRSPADRLGLRSPGSPPDPRTLGTD